MVTIEGRLQVVIVSNIKTGFIHVHRKFGEVHACGFLDMWAEINNNADRTTSGSGSGRASKVYTSTHSDFNTVQRWF